MQMYGCQIGKVRVDVDKSPHFNHDIMLKYATEAGENGDTGNIPI